MTTFSPSELQAVPSSVTFKPSEITADTGTKTPVPPKEDKTQWFIPDPVPENAANEVPIGTTASRFEQNTLEPEHQEPGIDYRTGLGFGHELMLSLMNDADMRKRYLDSKFGAANVKTDMYGHFYVIPDGFRKAGMTVPHKPVSASSASIAPIIGQIAPVIGMTIGGAATDGLLPGLLAAAAGSAGGEGVNQIIRSALYYDPQEPFLSDIKAQGKSALEGAGAELGGRFLAGLVKFPFGGYSRFISPVRLEQAKNAMKMGFTPTPGQGIKSAAILNRESALMENMFGSPVAKGNAANLMRFMRHYMAKAGVHDLSSSDLVDMMQHYQVPEKEGQDLIQRVKDYVDTLHQTTTGAVKQARTLVGSNLDILSRKLGGVDSADAAMHVRQDVHTAFRQFQSQSADLYGKVDELMGNQPVFPVKGINSTAKSILKNHIFIDPSVKAYFEKLATIKPLTFTQAQNIRSSMLAAMRNPDFLNNVSIHDLGVLTNEVNKSFDDAPVPQEAKNALNEANSFYRDTINKFDDPNIKTLLKESQFRGSVAPENVIHYVLDKHLPSVWETIRQHLTPATIGKVQSEWLKQLMLNSETNEYGATVIDGSRFYRNISMLNENGMLKSVYGKHAGSILDAARQLAAINGKIDPKLLGTTEPDMLVRNALHAQNIEDMFMKDNYLHMLAGPDMESTAAMDYILRPGSPDRLDKALKFYGNDPQIVNRFRAHFLGKMFSSLLDDPMGVEDNEIIGRNVLKTLDHYGRPTVERLFGKTETDDLFRFGHALSFVTKKSKVTTAFRGPQILFSPIHKFKQLASYFMANKYLLGNPSVVKWLIQGAAWPETEEGKAAMASLDAFIKGNAYANTITPDLSAPQPNQQNQTGLQPEDESYPGTPSYTQTGQTQAP